MTVSYYPSIATVRQGALIRLLLRWKGSLYKLVLPELVLFLVMYSAVSIVYRFALNEEQRKFFVNLCVYLDRYTNQSGLTFCLGFFVSIVMTRWWETFKTLPWLNTPSYVFRQYIVGGTEAECVEVRRRLVRYIVLSWILLTRKVSGQIMRRFKPSTSLLAATLQQQLSILNEDAFISRFHNKLITDEEIDMYMRFAKRHHPETYDTSYQPDYFVPLVWATDVVRNAKKRRLILSDFHEQHILRTLEGFRSQLAAIGLMDQFNIPLVYTQVVCWSMHVYFIFSLFAEQFHGAATNTSHGSSEASGSSTFDLFVPFPSLFQLAFYFGWIKVAEVCLNPFGDDDDDFPMWNILNMNVESSLKIVSISELSGITAEESEVQSVNSPTSAKSQGHCHHSINRRLSQTSQFDAFPDSDAAERYRDEYERLARKYERPTYRGSAIESQMDREAATANTVGSPVGSRLMRKVSSVFRGASQTNVARFSEDTNLLSTTSFSAVRVDRSGFGWNGDSSEAANIGDDSVGCGSGDHGPDDQCQSGSCKSSSNEDVQIIVPTTKRLGSHEDTVAHLEKIAEETSRSPTGSSSSIVDGNTNIEASDNQQSV